ELDGVGRRTYKDQAAVGNLAGKMRVLGEKTTAGMDRVRSACARRGDNLSAVEISRDRGGARDLDGAVGGGNRRRARIGGVMHHDCFQSQRLYGTQDTQRDLAAIGNQHALERPAAVRIGTTPRHYNFAFAELGQSPLRKISVMAWAMRCTSSGRLPIV